MEIDIPDQEELPLFGCVTGIQMPLDSYSIATGISFRRGLYRIFSSPMLAFKEAPPGSHTPGPWVAVHGGFWFNSRAELAIEDLSALDGFSPSRAAWLVATLMRLRFDAPVRIPAVANVPLALLPERRNAWALAFEAAPYHIGLFRASHVEVEEEDLQWLAESLPVAARLFREERFIRALSIFDESVWSARVEMGVILIWTAIEILFDLSREQAKTKALCQALSEYIASDERDRDKAYNVIRQLYEKRGRIVHAGRKIDDQDFAQSFMFARVALNRILLDGRLPRSRSRILQ